MIVVSDTSPIKYLILIELHGLLPKLFARILIPEVIRYSARVSDRRDELAYRRIPVVRPR
jgi:predicted nucleic acid-binding protein